jgi:serine/threonine-protein kinase
MQHRTFESYVLFKTIVEDALGHMYRAGKIADGALRGLRWLRVFDGEAVDAEGIVKALPDATKIAGFLKSANVVSQPHFFNEAGVPAIAWNYVPAQPLSLIYEKVHSEGFPVPVDNALLIMEKLSLALSAGLAIEAGGAPVAHGFLHPAVVQVSNDGEAIVAGFGIGEQLLSTLDSAQSANAVQPYLAPEVMLTRTTDRRSDVYSLGAILYQLLTGAPLPAQPDARSGCVEKAELAFEEEPVPDDIKALLSKTLAPVPEDRFSSAADFKKELDKLLYGGSYSPTTFNLALFMDRLFRAEIESEEKDRAEEEAIDVTPLLKPEPEPEPIPEVETEPLPAERSVGGGKGLWIGLASVAVIAAIAITVVIMMNRQPPAPIAPPTPTPEEIAAEQQKQVELYQRIFQEELEKQQVAMEERLSLEIKSRQDRIEQLTQQMQEMERQRRTGQEDAAARRNREEVQRQLTAEREAQRQQEEELESLPEQAAEQARLLAEEAVSKPESEEKTTTPEPGGEETVTLVGPSRAQPEPTAPPAQVPTAAPTAAPTTAPTAVPTTAPRAAPTAVVQHNQYLEPSNVDTMPAAIKKVSPSWSRLAVQSRREGIVIVRATVDAQGKVDEVSVLRADHEGFGIPQAAMDAVKKYVFKPGTKNGVKIKTKATVTVPYDFRRR